MEDSFHLGIKGLIRNQSGEILLFQVNPKKLKNTQEAYWDLPGGRVQKDSSIAETLQREIEEETGISDIQNIHEVAMVLSNIRIPITSEESVGLILGVYSCTIPEDATVALSDEHTAYDWFAPAEAASLLRVKYPDSFCDKIAQLA